MPIRSFKDQKTKRVTLNKFQGNQNLKSLSFDTYQEASDFIWNELKCLKKFNFSYSTEKKGWNIITYFKLKDSDIIYIIKNKKSFLKRNMLKIGDELMANAV